MRDIIVVLEEGNHPLLCCPICDMFVTCVSMNGQHQATEMCTNGREHKLKRLSE